MSVLLPQDRVEELPSTRHRDYILTDYEPVCEPSGRLHCATLLRHALRAADLLEPLWPVIETLRAHLGPEQTVWGLKYTPSGVGCELYFYNNQGNPPGHPMAVSRLRAVLEPHLRVDSRVDESLPYFMCSLELDRESLARREASGFRVYVGSGERARTPCGHSYHVQGTRLAFENHYAFYYADDPEQMRDLRARLAHSARAGGERRRRALLPDSLLPCRTVCHAIKPLHDGLYFSRITTDQLRRFLAEHLPGPLRELTGEHADDFAHLRWDVGYDFGPAPDGEPPRFDKIGIYGVV